MSDALALALIAESFVDCPFTLHGRDSKRGLDCVGLVHCALVQVGRGLTIETDYGLHNLTVDKYMSAAAFAGLKDVSGKSRPGDIVLYRLSDTQYHLGILSSQQSLVHAHAGLKRVVSTPLPLPWLIYRQWRIVEQQGT